MAYTIASHALSAVRVQPADAALAEVNSLVVTEEHIGVTVVVTY